MDYTNNPQGVVRRKIFCLLILFNIFFYSISSLAGIGELELNNEGSYELSLYKSGVIQVNNRVKRISVGNPGIVDLLILKSNQIYAVGKALGSTNVALWDSRDQIFRSFDIEVTHDLNTLKSRLHDLLPNEKILVHSAQERIILSGAVKNLGSVNAAVEIAYSFLPECIRSESDASIIAPDAETQPVVITQANSSKRSGNQECKEGKIINLMQVSGAQQVMLEVKVAEIARTLLRSLDSNFNIINAGDTSIGTVSGGAAFPNALTGDGLEVPVFDGLTGNSNPIGPVVDVFQPNTPSIADTGIFLSNLAGDTYFQAVIEASRRKGLAKILAEPTVTTLTGQEAKFISGGEFPVPVPRSGTTGVTVEFKEFGVGVKFLPTVLNADNINLKMNIEVSELSSNNTVVLGLQDTQSTFVVPSLTKRGAASTVELRNGQTIGIAGLISDNLRESIEKLPGLGDVPILGTLFRSQDFISGQTELVIFVTPHLAKPISPNEIKLPTEEFIEPDDYEFYLLGRLEGKSKAKDSDISSLDMIKSSEDEVQLFGHKF